MTLFTGSQAKMAKIQNSLLDLNREISTAAKFLQQLRQHSVRIVKNLNNITSPPVYLKQYIQVNSFLLKYLSVLTEMNCKFEIMQLLETTAKNDQNKKIEKPVENNDFNVVDQIEGIDSDDNRQVQNFNINGQTNPSGLQENISQKNEGVCNETQVKAVANSLSNLNLGKNDDCRSNLNSCIEQTLIPNDNLNNAKEWKNGAEVPQSNENLIQKASADSQQKSLNLERKTSGDMISDTHSVATCEDISRPSSIEFLPALQSTLTEDHLQGSRSVLNRAMSADIKTNNQNHMAHTDSLGIKPLNIPHKIGDEFKALVQYIKSPSEFYIHVINEDLEMLSDLEKKLKLFSLENQGMKLPKNENKKLAMSKEIGTFALYYSKCDEVWYRAKVNNWCIGYNDDLVNIFLIDYGEYKCVNIDSLQPMPEYFKKYPSFAIRCHLHKVFPMDDIERSKSLIWGRGCSEEMKRLIENAEGLKVKIAPNDFYHPPGSWPVLLWVTGETEECVNRKLVKNNFAIDSLGDEKVDSTKNSPAAVPLDTWNPMKEDYESYQNNYDLDVHDPAAAIYGYVGKDYDRICPQYRKTGRCFKGDSCRKEHGPVDPEGYTTDQEEVYKSAFNALPSPAVHETFNALVTCILGVNHFCCIREQSNWDPEEETLSSLLKFMNQPQNVKEMKKLLIPPSAGQIVIAQFSEDECWYRAKILESQPEQDLYTLVFVDYGNKERVTLSRIRAIEPRYLHLPFQVIQCFVYGIEKNPHSSAVDIIDYMNSKMAVGHVTIEVVSKFPGDAVCLLVNVFDGNGGNIAEDLIAKEYAVFKDEAVLSSESEALPG